MAEDVNENKGHRQRLKNRYINNGFAGFSDHEIIELLLFYAIPYKDTKDLAKRILKEVGGIKNLFDIRAEELMEICKVSEHVAILLTMHLDIHKRYLEPTGKSADFSTPNKAWAYLQGVFLKEKNECFYLATLDSNKKLIKCTLMTRGTIDETPVYIRDIVAEVLRTNARFAIVAHNHPSGSKVASKADILITKEIEEALAIVGVKLLDHIIAAGDGYVSLKI